VSQPGRAIHELVPRSEGCRDDGIVDNIVNEPLHLGTFEEKDDLSRGQKCAVAVEAEFLGVERRARGDECLGLVVRAFPVNERRSSNGSSVPPSGRVLRRLTSRDRADIRGDHEADYGLSADLRSTSRIRREAGGLVNHLLATAGLGSRP
jgi:hypothetical protein